MQSDSYICDCCQATVVGKCPGFWLQVDYYDPRSEKCIEMHICQKCLKRPMTELRAVIRRRVRAARAAAK